MHKIVKVLSLITSCLLMGACESNSGITQEITDKVYVLVEPEKESSFTKYLASVVAKHEMMPNLGQATDDKGYSTYVLDAASSSVRLRSENMLLSGQEDPEQCGVYSEPHPDPGQYFISVSPITQMADAQESLDLIIKITKDLSRDGYYVRTRPILCSNQSKLRQKS